MKKLLFMVVLIIAAVAGVTCYNNEKEEEMSDLAKANAKALAQARGVEKQCFWTLETGCLEKQPGVYCSCGLIYD